MAATVVLSGAGVAGKVALKLFRDRVKIDKSTYTTKMMYDMVRTEIGQIKRYVDAAAARSNELETAMTSLELLLRTIQIKDLQDPSVVHRIENLVSEHEWAAARLLLTDVLSNSKNPVFQVKATEIMIMMYTLEVLVSKLERTAFEDAAEFLLDKLFQKNKQFKIENWKYSRRNPQEENIEQLIDMLRRALPRAIEKLENWHGVLNWAYEWDAVIELPTGQSDFRPELFELIAKLQNQDIEKIFGVVAMSLSREQVRTNDGQGRNKTHTTDLIRPTRNFYQCITKANKHGCFTHILERIPHLQRLLAVKKDHYESFSNVSDGSDKDTRFWDAKVPSEDRLILPSWPSVRFNTRTGETTMLDIDSNDYKVVNVFSVDDQDFVVQTKEDEGGDTIITSIDAKEEHTVRRIDRIKPVITDGNRVVQGVGRTYAWRDNTGGDLTIALICNDGIKIHEECTLRTIEIDGEEVARPVAIAEHPSRFIVLDEKGRMFEMLPIDGVDSDTESLTCTATEVGRIKEIDPKNQIQMARAVGNHNEVAVSLKRSTGRSCLHFIPLPPTTKKVFSILD